MMSWSLCLFCLVFFFFKQKTAYEMRISDWSSDVCSSDLTRYQSYSRQNRPNHQQERRCSPRKFNRHDGSTFTIIRRLAPNQRRGQFYHHLQFVDELQRTWKPCI